jgi:hypothetical protein
MLLSIKSKGILLLIEKDQDIQLSITHKKREKKSSSVDFFSPLRLFKAQSIVFSHLPEVPSVFLDIEIVIEHLLGMDYKDRTISGTLETELHSSENNGNHQNYNELLKYVPDGVKVEFLGFKYNTSSNNYRLSTYLTPEKIKHKTYTRFRSKEKTFTDVFVTLINDQKENLFEVVSSLTNGVKE